MSSSIRWNSQPLDDWAMRHARGKRIEIGGDVVHYIQLGKGPTLMMLHGFYLDSHMWDSNMNELAKHFTVYVPDLWGFGYSSRLKEGYSHQLYVDQILDLMDALELEHASFMGQSMGGGTAMLLAIQNPALVDRLVLVDPAGLPTTIQLTSKMFQLPRVGEFLSGLNTDFIRRKNLADFWIFRKEMLTQQFFDDATRF